MKIGLIGLVFSITLLLFHAHSEEFTQIRSYFGHLESEFFVAIGQSSLLSSMIAQELKTWKGIYLLSDSSKIRYALNNGDQNQYLHWKLPGGEQSQALQLPFLDVCRSYFLKTPKLLTVSSFKDHTRIFNSINSLSSQCLAEIVLVERITNQSEVSRILASKGYAKLAHKNGIVAYGLQKLFGVFTQRKVEYQIANKRANTPFFSYQMHLPDIYRAILPSRQISDEEISRPSRIYIHQTRHRFLSFPDLIKETRYSNNVIKPILVLNFHARDDYIYIGSSNFTVSEMKIKNYLVKKIILHESNEIQQIFILINDNSKWLQMIAENGNVFYQKESQYNNAMAYKNKCFEYQHYVRVVIRQEIQLHGIDATSYGDLERPFKQMVRIQTVQEEQVIIIDNDGSADFPLVFGLTILVVAIIALIVVKLYRFYKRERTYQNISKDPISNDLHNEESATNQRINLN